MPLDRVNGIAQLGNDRGRGLTFIGFGQHGSAELYKVVAQSITCEISQLWLLCMSGVHSPDVHKARQCLRETVDNEILNALECGINPLPYTCIYCNNMKSCVTIAKL